MERKISVRENLNYIGLINQVGIKSSLDVKPEVMYLYLATFTVKIITNKFINAVQFKLRNLPDQGIPYSVWVKNRYSQWQNRQLREAIKKHQIS